MACQNNESYTGTNIKVTTHKGVNKNWFYMLTSFSKIFQHKTIAFNIIDSTSVQATNLGAYGTTISIFFIPYPCQCFNHIFFFPLLLQKKS